MTLEIKCPPRPFQEAERAAEKQNDKDIKITNPNPANISTIFFGRLHSVTVGHAEKSSLSTNRRGFAHWGSPIKTRKWIKFSFAKAIWLHSGVGPETTRDQVKFPICVFQKRKKAAHLPSPTRCILKLTPVPLIYPLHTHTHRHNTCTRARTCTCTMGHLADSVEHVTPDLGIVSSSPTVDVLKILKK